MEVSNILKTLSLQHRKMITCIMGLAGHAIFCPECISVLVFRIHFYPAWWNQAITNVDLLPIRNLRTHFNEMLIKMVSLSFKETTFCRPFIQRNKIVAILQMTFPNAFKIHLKVSSAKWHPFCSSIDVLTHLSQDKMASITQTIFWDAFSWLKIFVFWLKFHWSSFLRVQLAISQHCFRQWLETE